MDSHARRAVLWKHDVWSWTSRIGPVLKHDRSDLIFGRFCSKQNAFSCVDDCDSGLL